MRQQSGASAKSRYDPAGGWPQRSEANPFDVTNLLRDENKSFEHWYIDPFAGSGERVERRLGGGLMEGRALEEETVSYAGSAKRALEVTPRFAHYRFADTKSEHVEALNRLKDEYPDCDVQIFPGDGNECVRKIVANRLWTGPSGWKQRGIVFLDPYGMDVSWQTLQLIAKTERLDVWFLFAAKAVRQQLGGGLDRVDEGKALALDRFFGESSWREEFFRSVPTQTSFLDTESVGTETAVDLKAIGEYARKRFEDAFCWVSEPRPLKVAHVPDYFQLYCMTNNPSTKAQELIRKLHAGVIKSQR